MSQSFFDDDRKLSYPEADRLVDRYLDRFDGVRSTTTSTHVLEWGGEARTPHNQRRVFDALSLACEATDDDWRGRIVFELPTETETKS